MPTRPHEVIAADVVYPAILLVHGRPLSLLSAMVGCLQSGLQILCQNLGNVAAEEDRKGRGCRPRWRVHDENTKSLRGITLHISYGMVYHALPVFDVSGAVF